MDIDFGPGDYEAEWVDRTPSPSELAESEGGGACPRCSGPLTVEIPDLDTGHLGGTYCENVLDTDGMYFCMWPDEPVSVQAYVNDDVLFDRGDA